MTSYALFHLYFTFKNNADMIEQIKEHTLVPQNLGNFLNTKLLKYKFKYCYQIKRRNIANMKE